MPMNETPNEKFLRTSLVRSITKIQLKPVSSLLQIAVSTYILCPTCSNRAATHHSHKAVSFRGGSKGSDWGDLPP